MRDFRLPLWSRWYLHSSVTLCSRVKKSKDFFTLEDGTDKLAQKSGRNYHYTLHTTAEERRTHCAYKFAFSALKGICNTTVLFSCHLPGRWNTHFVQITAYNSKIHIYTHTFIFSRWSICVGYTNNKIYSSHVDIEMAAHVWNTAIWGMTKYYSLSACNTDQIWEGLGANWKNDRKRERDSYQRDWGNEIWKKWLLGTVQLTSPPVYRENETLLKITLD